MQVSSFIPSFIKPKTHVYSQKEERDIAAYGKKEVHSIGVSQDLVDTFTPHRRVSKKPCDLSDHKYFIDKYGDNVKAELKHKDWDSLSEADKIDYIVKSRYRRLIANKIMNTLKSEPKESHFLLSENGEILAFDKGKASHVDIKNARKARANAIKTRQKLIEENKTVSHIEEDFPLTSVHNHPEGYSDMEHKHCSKTMQAFEQYTGLGRKDEINPFSFQDVLGYVIRGQEGYVVDSNGNKFTFKPKPAKDENCPHYDKFIADDKNVVYSQKAYDDKKAELDKYIESGAEDKAKLKQLQKDVLLEYFKIMQDFVTRDKLREYLKSDFVKEYLGEYVESLSDKNV